MRDQILFSYLKSCGLSDYRARRTYPAFAVQVGLKKSKNTLIVPEPDILLPAVLHKMRILDAKPHLVNEAEYARLCGSVDYFTREAARHKPNTLLGRKARRSLRHATIHKHALAYCLNEITPSLVPDPPAHAADFADQPSKKRSYARRPPGMAQTLAALRYQLKLAERRLHQHQTDYHQEQERRRALIADYERASAKHYLTQLDHDETLLQRKHEAGVYTLRRPRAR